MAEMNLQRAVAARRELYRCLVMATLFCLATSCRSHAKVEEPAGNLPPAAESIAQADQLYAGRGDLNNLRRGIIALGRARLADPASFDAAWRLAKFDSYLATHTDNTAERDRAFREGIEAGKAAVKLQDDRRRERLPPPAPCRSVSGCRAEGGRAQTTRSHPLNDARP